MSPQCEEGTNAATVRTTSYQVPSRTENTATGSRVKTSRPRATSTTMSTALVIGVTATVLLVLIPACHAAGATSQDEEGRSFLNFSPSALKKRLGSGLRSTGRSYFDAEDILLFMLGLGLASMLGLATFMAPFTSILATGLTPVTVQGNVPPAAAAVTHGRRRRRSAASWTDGTHAADLLHAIDETHARYKEPL